MPRHLLIVFLSWVLAGLAAPPPGALTHCADIRGLTREQAAEKRPVEVVGVVTYVANEDGDAFVLEDPSEAIYVTWRGRQKDSSPGSAAPRVSARVRVRGVTGPGGFAPVVIASEVVVEGEKPIAPPAKQTLSQLRTGTFDCHRVEMQGIVQRAERTRGKRPQIRIQIAAIDGSFSAFIANSDGLDDTALVDAEVRVSGVCFTLFNPRGEAVGVHLQVAGTQDLLVVKPAPPDPFAVPEVAPLALRPYSLPGPSLHRQRLRGVVTLSRPGEFVYVQMPERGVRVNTRGTESLSPGDEIEASGFVSPTLGFAVLNEAVVRRIGQGAIPAPLPIQPAQVLAVPGLRTDVLRQEDYDGTLVRISGRLLKVESNPGESHRIFLDANGSLIVATLGAQVALGFLAEIPPGTEVEATGVCAVRLSDRWPALVIPVPESFVLLLQDPASLRIVRAPEWWSPQRLAIALGISIAVLSLSLAWGWTLRRRVASRSAALAEEMRARRDAAVEFETTLRERTRLAADLHDTLEQSLTGLALQLEAADALHTEAPERSEQHLSLARQLLARSREDVRRSVWNLRANPLEGATFTEALRQIAADRSSGLPLRITVESTGEPFPLPDFIAGNLLLLAQEAITNALKHAAPSQIALRLDYRADALELRIRDDGRGFIPTQAPGPREGHFGLQGMRERAKRIGGVLNIQSAEGEGTALSVSLPREQSAV